MDTLPNGSYFVAGMAPPQSRSAFNRAGIIVLTVNGSDRSLVSGSGASMTGHELESLIDAGHATAVTPVPRFCDDATLWVLRPNFPDRESAINELQAAEILISHQVTEADVSLCIIRTGPIGSGILEHWINDAMGRARHQLRNGACGDWAGAVADAELAQALGSGLRADVMALLLMAYTCDGQVKRVNSILAMIDASKPSQFVADIRLQIAAEWGRIQA
jgi:hypothetical protein